MPVVRGRSAMAVAKPNAKPAPKVVPKPEDGWRTARLIPTTGIGGQDEQEERATSSLLAVMRAVPRFGRAILAHVGAPVGRISTFTEIRFLDENEKLSIPDGAVIIEWGQNLVAELPIADPWSGLGEMDGCSRRL